MSFSYDAGSTTATYAGLVEFNSVRLNDGTFKTTTVPPVMFSPPIRESLSVFDADAGGLAGTPFYDPWTFDLEGWLLVTSPDDVTAAQEYLRAAFNLQAGLQTLKINARGWTVARQLTARVTGQIQFLEPTVELKKVPRRDFVIPMLAPDPLSYNNATLQSVSVLSGGTSLTNNGTTPTPFVVRFNGPLVNPRIDGPGAAPTNRIRWSGTIPIGHWVEMGTNAASAGGVYAYDDTGANAYGNGSTYGTLASFTADAINPGASTWTLTADSGAGTAVVSFRDAWA